MVTKAQQEARLKFKIYARARLNYMNAHKDKNGKRHRPPKSWKPTAHDLAIARKQLGI